MKKYLSALALAALVGAPAAQALDTTFGGEYEMNGYRIDDKVGDDTAAFQQLLRLRVHNKADSGVQINTSFNLSNSTWEGDGLVEGTSTPANNNFSQGEFSNRANETVTLDYGYVVIPMGGNSALTVGRVTSNWPACFLVCDDRRDRFIFSTKIGAHTILPIYTHKAEGDTTVDAGDRSDAQVVAVGPLGGGWSYFAALAYHFTGNSDELMNEAIAFSPYVKGKVGPATVQLGYTYLGGGAEQAAALGEGFGWSDDSHAAFARVGADFGIVGVEGQVAATIDGGLMSAGFDSFSSQISNNPTQNRNPVSLISMGSGFGVAGYDELLLAARLTVTPVAKLKLMVAAGQFEIEVGGADADTTFYDLQAHYELAPATTAWVSYGMVSGDTGTDNLFQEDVTAATLNLRTVF